MNVEATIASYGLATEFPIKAQKLEPRRSPLTQIKRFVEDDSQDTIARKSVSRRPPDAKDFDDAVGEREMAALSSGFILQMWAHYVKWDSPIDLEARMRTCSAYLVDRVLPMLPEKALQ